MALTSLSLFRIIYGSCSPVDLDLPGEVMIIGQQRGFSIDVFLCLFSACMIARENNRMLTGCSQEAHGNRIPVNNSSFSVNFVTEACYAADGCLTAIWAEDVQMPEMDSLEATRQIRT